MSSKDGKSSSSKPVLNPRVTGGGGSSRGGPRRRSSSSTNTPSPPATSPWARGTSRGLLDPIVPPSSSAFPFSTSPSSSSSSPPSAPGDSGITGGRANNTGQSNNRGEGAEKRNGGGDSSRFARSSVGGNNKTRKTAVEKNFSIQRRRTSPSATSGPGVGTTKKPAAIATTTNTTNSVQRRASPTDASAPFSSTLSTAPQQERSRNSKSGGGANTENNRAHRSSRNRISPRLEELRARKRSAEHKVIVASSSPSSSPTATAERRMDSSPSEVNGGFSSSSSRSGSGDAQTDQTESADAAVQVSSSSPASASSGANLTQAFQSVRDESIPGNDGDDLLCSKKTVTAATSSADTSRLLDVESASARSCCPISNNNKEKVTKCCATTVAKKEDMSSSVGCCFCGDSCTCGDDCMCSEELCQCTAFQLIHSLSSFANSRSARSAGCCSPPKKNNSQPPHLLRSDAAVDPLAAPPPLTENHSNTGRTDRAEFLISGMTCSMCSQAIENAVRALSNVQSVEISLTTDTAVISWTVIPADDGSEGEDDDSGGKIRSAIEAIGYDVEDVKMIFQINGGGDDGSEDVADETVEDRWQRYRQRQQDKVRNRRCAFIAAIIGAAPILLMTMVMPHIAPNLFHHKQFSILHKTIDLEAFLLWMLATPVQFVCGWEFYKMAWFGFRSGRAGMDVLVALGTTASYGYAAWGTLNGDAHAAHFFETSAVLIAFVLAGKWMQAAAVRRTSDALTQLMQLQSPTAVKITSRNTEGPFNPLVDPYDEETVDIKQVLIGDVVKVIRGASIPADGKVMFGEISVDESMVTGESVPVLKTPGSVVLGGTICVESGMMGVVEDDEEKAGDSVGAAFIQVTGVGSSTALAQIVKMVQEAQSKAVPIQAFADEVSAVFVPAVCTISLITYLVWYVFFRIFQPCWF
jgi:copper chaperone CopZ